MGAIHRQPSIEPTGVSSLEIFDEDDFAAALARLDELGAAEPTETRAPGRRTPRPGRGPLRSTSCRRSEDAASSSPTDVDGRRPTSSRSAMSSTRPRRDPRRRPPVRSTPVGIDDSGYDASRSAVIGSRCSARSSAPPTILEIVLPDHRRARRGRTGRRQHDRLRRGRRSPRRVDELDARYLAGEGAPHAELAPSGRGRSRAVPHAPNVRCTSATARTGLRVSSTTAASAIGAMATATIS